MVRGRLVEVLKSIADEDFCEGCNKYGDIELNCAECMVVAVQEIIEILSEEE